jgi:heme exporter protein A
MVVSREKMDRLETVALECTRGDRPLVRNLSFVLAAGELLHVAGSNGSGKTTLLRTLCGLSHPNAGEVRWNGANVSKLGEEYRGQLAFVGHSDGIQGELSPQENLQVAARLVGGADEGVMPALERVGLSRVSTLSSKLLSQGQKRRLGLARLLMADRALWILDEPFSGLDARSVATVQELLAEHLANGGLVVITSHQHHDWRARTVRHIDLDS